MEESQSQSHHPLPSHPTARAFFDALDSNNKATTDDSGSTKRRTSAFVQKQLTSLGWRNRHSQEEQYPVTVLETSFSVQQVQRGEIEGTYGTGACVWPAAMVLVKYMEKCHLLLENKTVVDLGSGTGVTSIAAAILGATLVICTDGCDKVVQLARKNIEAASREIGDSTSMSSEDSLSIRDCQLYLQELWWGRDSIDTIKDSKNNRQVCTCQDVDIVLVADCVLPKLYPIAPLVQAIDELLVKPTAMALISYEHRYYPEYDPRTKFQELATERGLVVETVPMEEHDPVYSVDDIEIWKVYRRANT